MYKSYFKVVIDWTISLIAIIVLSPLLFLVAIAVKIDSKGPILFKQKRLGKYGKEFTLLKFRSMRTNSAVLKDNKLFENDPRITKTGSFIRKTSLDELPQLINILKGDMSLIGPRPPVVSYPKKYTEYTDFEKQRFFVKPGLSGLAQIRCREVHDWSVNIPIDVEYVNNYSFIYDFKLFVNSFLFFFKTGNVYRKPEK